MKKLAILLLCFLPFFLFAEKNRDTIIEVSTDLESISIGSKIYYIEDSNRKLNFAEIKSSEYSDKFELSEVENPNFGYTLSAYWIRFHLKNTSQKPLEIILECGYPLINDIELYISDNEIRKAGIKFPFEKREIHYRNNIFKLQLQPDSVHTFYMRFKTESSMQFPLTIYTSETFFEKINTEQLLWGFYFGIVLIMAIYNLFLFLSLKNLNYLYFVFYAILFGFSQFSVHGFSYEFLWNNSGSWTLFNISFFFNLSAAFAIQFAQSFLNTKNDTRKLHLILEIFKWINVANAALAFILEFKYTSKITVFVIIISSVVLVVAGTIRIIQSFKPARYFLLAWIVFLLGTIIYTIKVYGLLPTTFLTEYALNFGNVLEITLLSFALAHSYKLIKSENEQTQNKLLQLQQKTNEELERQIEERTDDIVRKNNELLAAEEELKQQNEELSTISENLHFTNESLKEEKIKVEEINQKITKAYDDLFKNEKKLSAIFDTANEGIALVNKNGCLTYVNTCVCEIFGYKLEEILKVNYFELLGEINETNKDNFQKLVSGELDVIFTENLYIRKDKTKFWGKLSARCIRNSKGEFEQIVGILTDIDKLKKSEEKLNHAFKELSITNQKLNIIFDSPTVGIGICNSKYDFIFANKRLSDMVACPNDELLTKNFIDFIAPEDRKKIILEFRNLLRGTDNRITIDVNFQKNDKTRIWANFTGSNIYDENGKIKMIVGIIADISKLKESEEKLKQSYNNIQQLSEIGIEITANLKIENIVETVYEHVNKLMIAEVTAIGIFQPKKSGIQIYAKEKNKTLESFFFNLSDKNRLCVFCYKQKREIFINDMDLEYSKYIEKRQKPFFGKSVSSIIYLPLISKNECVGTLSIQSYNKNTFTENNLNILRNIAVYLSIALDNGNAFLKIEEQKEEIEKSHNKITSSINYAQRIQMAVLPDIELVSMLLPHNFILFKPRDIVSGDFYFLKQVKNYTILALGDCTGHGIPGAFMCMLGIAVLNEIIRNAAILSPSEILNELRKQIKIALQQTGEIGEQQDGMDIALCVINLENMKMRYSGANIPCWIFRSELRVNSEELRVKSEKLKVKSEKLIDNSEKLIDKREELIVENEKELLTLNSKLLTLEPDHQPIGIYINEKPFSENKIQLLTNDILYIFSDGYISQFSADNNEKFKTKRFKDLLSEIYFLPLSEQNQILETKFNEWKGNNEQTDDVLVVGVKI